MKVYQQAGHNTTWNTDSFSDDSAGDGIIFSPVHLAQRNMEGIASNIRRVSLFDPQFYVPNSQRNKINTYSFFPEKALDGFETREYLANAVEIAEECVEFQEKMGFEAIIIPARYYDQMITDFTVRQERFSVAPFVQAITTKNCGKDNYLTLPLTEAMILDKGYRDQILNWITGIQAINGVYLLVSFEEPKQVTDYRKLAAYFAFIRDLHSAELKVICGCCNTEGLLLTALDVAGVTMGSFENTRRFSIDKFLEPEDQRGPAPRLYFPKLLNWLRHEVIIELRDDHPEIWDEIYEPTGYSDEFMSRDRPAFNQAEAYKHHFIKIYEQYQTLSKLTVADRIQFLRDRIREAINIYAKIERANVAIVDPHSNGNHLQAWNRLLNNL